MNATRAHSLRQNPQLLVHVLRGELLHVSLAELAIMLGVHVHSVWRWEVGINKPRPKHQRRLIALFDRTIGA